MDNFTTIGSSQQKTDIHVEEVTLRKQILNSDCMWDAPRISAGGNILLTSRRFVVCPLRINLTTWDHV